ncbi:hypothetical protein J132_10850 [Termitomyces sp. J132]|nr:hypothetical protein J132_10850 [Termitomyces sp. J132]
MAPLRRSGTIVTCLFLQSLSRGLTLDVPSNVVLGQTTRISWTSSSADPGRMDLYMRCNGGRFLNKIASSVSTAAESSFVTMPSPPDRDGLNLPLCVRTRFYQVENKLTFKLIQVSALSGLKHWMCLADDDIASGYTQGKFDYVVHLNVDDWTQGNVVQFHFFNIDGHTQVNLLSLIDLIDSTETPTKGKLIYIICLSSHNLRIRVYADICFVRNPSLVTTSTSHNTAFTSESTQKSMIPLGAIVGGVVGGLVVLGILTILLICIRRRYSPSALAPVPFAYDQNYIQPSEKSNRLSKIINERQVDQWQRGQSQTEVERITHSSPSALSDTSSACEPLGRQVESLQYRILGLEVQQRNFEHQLYGEQPPPSYLD